MIVSESTFRSFVGFWIRGISGIKWCAPLVPPEPELPPIEPAVKGELVTPEPEQRDKWGLTVAFVSGLLVAQVLEVSFNLVLAVRSWVRNLLASS